MIQSIKAMNTRSSIPNAQSCLSCKGARTIDNERVNSTSAGSIDISSPVVIKSMHLRRSARIRARMSPSVKMPEQDDIIKSLSPRTSCAPLSQETTSNSDHHTKDNISDLRRDPCSVHLHDIFFILMTQQLYFRM